MGIFLMIDVGVPSALWVVPPLGRWSLGNRKKKSRAHNGSTQVSSRPSWPVPQFLPRVLGLRKSKVKKGIKVK